MKKILLTLLATAPFLLQAQTFNASPGTAILDNQETCFGVTVSGLATQINSNFGVMHVCVNIAHTFDAQLKVRLIAPDNTSILLANNDGGNGDNFTNTCFSEDGINGLVNAGIAPFSGTYIPFQSLNLVNNGQNPNGNWQVCVKDEVPLNQGTFISFSITFGANPPIDPIPSGPCSVANGAGCSCPDGSQNCDLLPDMTASAAIIASQHFETPGLMTLSNATPNIGWGPMEIHGSNSCWCDTVNVPCSTVTCPDGSYPRQRLKQTIYHKSGNVITSYDTLRPGYMSYHPTHGHIHVNNWAVFTLRTPTSNPDATTWPIVASGAKISFCLINLGNCDGTPGYCLDGNGGPGMSSANISNYGFGQVTGCGVDQGIYVGNFDIYSSGLAGMSMDLTGVCNGDYYIVSITDPDNNFIESDETNNWAATPVTLTQQVPRPVASFTYVQNQNQVQFNNPSNINYTYKWFFGDGGTSENENPSHTYTSNGIFPVTEIVSSQCGNDTLTQTLSIINIGIDEPSVSVLGYSLYPNPSTESTTVSYFVPEKSDVTFEVFNVVGEKVYTISKGMQDIGHYEFNFNSRDSGLKQGVYFVQLKTQTRTASLRLMLMDK